MPVRVAGGVLLLHSTDYGVIYQDMFLGEVVWWAGCIGWEIFWIWFRIAEFRAKLVGCVSGWGLV